MRGQALPIDADEVRRLTLAGRPRVAIAERFGVTEAQLVDWCRHHAVPVPARHPSDSGAALGARPEPAERLAVVGPAPDPVARAIQAGAVMVEAVAEAAGRTNGAHPPADVPRREEQPRERSQAGVRSAGGWDPANRERRDGRGSRITLWVRGRDGERHPVDFLADSPAAVEAAMTFAYVFGVPMTAVPAHQGEREPEVGTAAATAT